MPSWCGGKKFVSWWRVIFAKISFTPLLIARVLGPGCRSSETLTTQSNVMPHKIHTTKTPPIICLIRSVSVFFSDPLHVFIPGALQKMSKIVTFRIVVTSCFPILPTHPHPSSWQFCCAYQLLWRFSLSFTQFCSSYTFLSELSQFDHSPLPVICCSTADPFSLCIVFVHVSCTLEFPASQ
jgi:hypothetical protein